MSIASEITRLNTAKADIKSAIEAKGVEVPSSALIDTYDDYIAQIEGGGGCSVASANSITFDAMGRVSSVEYKEGVTSIPNYIFMYNSSLTSVTFPSTLTSIGVAAFEHCTGLTSLIIPSSVTNIGAVAFYDCSGLTGITVEATTPPAMGSTNVFDLTNNCPIYVPCASAAAYKAANGWSNYADRIVACDGVKYAFYGTNGNLVQSGACNGSGDLGYYGGDSYDVSIRQQVKTAIVGECVSSFTNSFSNCSAMTDVTILSTGLTAINEYSFNWCYALTGLTIPSTVTTLGQQAFQSCRSLTSVNIPSGVTSIPVYCFHNCWSLTGVSMPNVTTIGDYAFYNCSGMTSITLPTGLTDIGEEAFGQCSGLTSVTIPSSVTSIGQGAFAWCTGLTGITVEATTPPTIGTGAFSDTNDCPIIVPAGTLSAYQSAWSDYASRLVEMSSCDCQYNFCGEDELGGEIIIDNGSSRLDNADFDNNGDPRLPARGTVGSLTTTIGEYCFDMTLEEITICNSVTTIEHEAFNECENLASITIPSSVQTIGFWAFTRCNSLQEVIFEGTTPPTFVGDAIYHDFYPDVTYVPDSALSDYRAIINWADGDGTEDFNPITNIRPISERGCDCQYNFCGEDERSEEFTVNNGTNEIKSTDFDSHSPVRGTVGSLTTTIREYCFGRSLSEITLCNSVTTIEHEAFNECENLLEVTIPASVTGIGFYAFTRCYSMEEVIFEGTTPPAFLDGDGEPSLSEPIYWGHFPSVTYVPDSALSAYRAIPNWVGDVHEEQFDPYVNIKPISERV